jgi:hypothetical protein
MDETRDSVDLTDVNADELIAMLSEQRDLYRRLSNLADRQRGLITGDDPERLLEVLAERQKLIDRLMASARELAPYQENWTAVRGSLSSPEEERVDQIVSEMQGLLSGILETDQADADLLSARKGTTARAIESLKTGRQAGSAYAQSSVNHRQGADWADE